MINSRLLSKEIYISTSTKKKYELGDIIELDINEYPTLEDARKMEQEHYEKFGEHINVLHK